MDNFEPHVKIHNALKCAMLLVCWLLRICWGKIGEEMPHPARFSTLEVVPGIKTPVGDSRVSGLGPASADSAQRQPCLEV